MYSLKLTDHNYKLLLKKAHQVPMPIDAYGNRVIMDYHSECSYKSAFLALEKKLNAIQEVTKHLKGFAVALIELEKIKETYLKE